MKEKLDEIDMMILRLLQEDGRTTNADLARHVKLSPPSVLQRVRKLEENGVVRRYTAVLDREAMGFPLLVCTQISLALHQERAIETFRKSIVEIPEVIECLHVSGDFDFLLRIVVRDMHHYEELVRERLSRIRGVGKLQSCFVLAENKQTTELPI